MLWRQVALERRLKEKHMAAWSFVELVFEGAPPEQEQLDIFNAWLRNWNAFVPVLTSTGWHDCQFPEPLDVRGGEVLEQRLAQGLHQAGLRCRLRALSGYQGTDRYATRIQHCPWRYVPPLLDVVTTLRRLHGILLNLPQRWVCSRLQQTLLLDDIGRLADALQRGQGLCRPEE